MKTKEEINELVLRNKKILLREINNSKELANLLGKSTYAKLTEEERIKVKKQLLDICRGIPAFTIFMLPGGAILLPILIKLIPDLLPSNYRKNKNTEDQ
ncbi:LETM1 domain-containing protein [Urechidicola croceus]|uniref:Letm1 RBD domain-containing protein n=1 Tax=Urechidicola croceus TaxID=1850246 RepID=A0A1D8P572_9FLAO|nr:LETM1 domain-containing protein [Urechidicola croceus]AOW19719.1 hypothetical protein LPB138_03055 [Urechidicola croceus]